MTFEEFITKKKIDLAQFRAAEPGLFAEFQSHYSQMGEKSFDHSKKFWFNKLRRAYHLKEEPKPLKPTELAVNEIAAQAEPLLSPTIEATVYTPRFRAPTPKGQQSAESSEGGNANTPAYKPRFSPTSASDSSTKADASTEAPKPAFKPRFKAGLTGSTETGSAETKAEDTIEENKKPAYVPRFRNPGTASPQDAVEPGIPDALAKAMEKDEKPSYKPRFKANITTSPDPAADVETPGPVQAPAPGEQKPSYKPRFKPSILKPPPKDE